MLKKRSFFAAVLIIILTLGVFLYMITFCGSYSVYIPENYISDLSDIKIKYSQDGIVSHSEPVYDNGYIRLTFNSLKQGKTEAEIFAFKESDPQSYFSQFVDLRLNAFNILTNGNYHDNLVQDISGYPVFYIAGALFFGIMAVYMIIRFRKSLKKHLCSYSTVFDCSLMIVFVGLAILFIALSVFLLIHYREYQVSSTQYQTTIIMLLTILFSTPFVLLYSLSMTVSNISLICHEGFRVANALGIIISAVMTLGVFVCIIVPFRFIIIDRNSHIVYSIICALYVFSEVLLLGTKICALKAAKHKPEYDKDYIIILGCGIRKDGTLLPLLKGRVDKAIEFYNEQLQATGKKAVFVPSGGQGSDEIISEGEAMQRYLLEQGIPKEQIMPETKSTNTFENMKFSKELIADSDAKVAFSTTNYHVFRSGIFASQAGLNAEGMGSKTKWYFWPNAFIREFIGLILSQKQKIIVLAVLTLLIIVGTALLTVQ